MSKYIDRDVLADYAYRHFGGLTASEIMRFPTADVQPVKHGQFEEYSEKEKYEVYKKYHRDFDGLCSECGSHMFRDDKFCADCGARMDGDIE